MTSLRLFARIAYCLGVGLLVRGACCFGLGWWFVIVDLNLVSWWLGGLLCWFEVHLL